MLLYILCAFVGDLNVLEICFMVIWIKNDNNLTVLFTGNHYENQKVWLSQVISQEGTKVWRSNKKPVDYNEYRVNT